MGWYRAKETIYKRDEESGLHFYDIVEGTVVEADTFLIGIDGTEFIQLTDGRVFPKYLFEEVNATVLPPDVFYENMPSGKIEISSNDAYSLYVDKEDGLSFSTIVVPKYRLNFFDLYNHPIGEIFYINGNKSKMISLLGEDMIPHTFNKGKWTPIVMSKTYIEAYYILSERNE